MNSNIKSNNQITESASASPVADFVFSSSVEWIRRDDARRMFGIGRDLLDRWAYDGIVEAHKLNSCKNGSLVFKAADIRSAIENSPRFGKPKNKV